MTTASAVATLDRRDVGMFRWIAGAVIVGGILFAAVGKLELAAVIPGLVLLALLYQSPAVIISALFVTFSYSIHLSVFTWDVPLTVLLSLRWMIDRPWKRGVPIGWSTGRRLVLLTAFYVGAAFILMLAATPLNGQLASVGSSLLLDLLLFAVVFDFACTFSLDRVHGLLLVAWGCSVAVCAFAVFEHEYFGYTRVSSFLEVHHAHLGNYALASAALGGVVYAGSRVRGIRIASALSIPLALLALIVSESRADITGAAVALVIFASLRGWRGMAAAVLVAGVLYASGIATRVVEKQVASTVDHPSSNVQGVQANYDVSSVDRVFIWLGVVDLETQSTPVQRLFGYGPGSFYTAAYPYTELFRIYSGEIANGAHNNFLHVLVELGAAGVALLFGCIGMLCLRMFRDRRMRGAQSQSIMALMVAATVGLLVSGLTQETFYTQPAMGNFLAFYFVLMALAAQYVIPRTGQFDAATR